MVISIINGPNLNKLGKREPEVYGTSSFEDYLTTLKSLYPQHTIRYFQSNIEGEIIDQIQDIESEADGIILNPGAYTHTSVAIADCLASVKIPIVEVHISNIYKREPFRHHSYTAAKSNGVISGLGLKGYELALNFITDQNK